jgi:hypothetical protein
MITVGEIVIEYMKANGFDGLCGDECGCGIEDLGCGEDWKDCTFAHSRILGENEWVEEAGPGDTIYSTDGRT